MKTSEFYCPLHNNSSTIITTESCHIDSWDQYICYECDKIKKDCDKIESWFSNTNSSLDNSVKEKIKANQLVYYEANHFDYNHAVLHQLLTKYSYYNGNILNQHLYQCGILTKRSLQLDWRLSYRTMRSCYTLDLEYVDDDIPYLFLDDENLIKTNYKRKHSDG